MPALSRCVVLVLLAIAFTAATALCITQADVDPNGDATRIDCSSTRMKNCRECYRVNDLQYCSLCADNYALYVSKTQNVETLGTCTRINSNVKCALPNCKKCASNDPTLCTECDASAVSIYPTNYTCYAAADPQPKTLSTTALPCQAAHCEACLANSSSLCRSCVRGYALFLDFTCHQTSGDAVPAMPTAVTALCAATAVLAGLLFAA